MDPSVQQNQASNNFNQTIIDQKNPSDQIRNLGERIEKADIAQDLREHLIERIKRLALLRVSSGYLGSNYILEYESTLSYVNWILGIPWKDRTNDILDLIKAKEILDKNHYGLPTIKDRILEYLATIVLNSKQNTRDHIIKAPILCLVGLAGTGKTTLAQSIAESLGRKFERIPFGGMGDARALRGQSRAFADAEPGAVIKKLAHSKNKNSVILLDEIDRVSEIARSDIMGVLVELLDPEQNKAFLDHYIDFPFDLSEVLFIATSNNTTNISTAVLDRLEIIQMPSYTDEEKVVIGRDYIFPKIRSLTGLSEAEISVANDVWPIIIRPLGFDSGIRSLQRSIEGICRKTARIIVEGKSQAVVVNNQNIKEFLPS